MNRRTFLRGWGAAIGAGIVTPTYFLAPSGGWHKDKEWWRYFPAVLTKWMPKDLVAELHTDGRWVLRPTTLIVHSSGIGTPELQRYRRSIA